MTDHVVIPIGTAKGRLKKHLDRGLEESFQQTAAALGVDPKTVKRDSFDEQFARAAKHPLWKRVFEK